MINPNLWTLISVQAVYQDLLMSPATKLDDSLEARQFCLDLIASMPQVMLELLMVAIIERLGWRGKAVGWVQ